MCFVAHDDVWLAPVGGGRASRLTSDGAPARNPRFSPDGRRVAYTSARSGAMEVHVCTVDGGESAQLTYWGCDVTFVEGWLPDGRVLVASGARQPFVRRLRLFAVALDGAWEELPYGVASALALGPAGTAVTTPNARDHAMWKRYRGGTASQLWLRGSESGEARAHDEWTRVLPETEAGIYNPAWVGQRLCFCSDLDASLDGAPDEQGQLYSVDASGGDLRRHTAHTSADGYVRNPATDGTRLVYHARGRLYLLESLADEPKRLDISVNAPLPPYEVKPSQRLLDVVPDHGGDLSVVEWYGAVYALTHRAGPARALAADSGVRARLPRVLGSSGLVAYATDVADEDCIEVSPLDASAKPRRLGRGKVGRALSLQSSPSGDNLGVVTHDGRICVMDTASGRVKEVGRSPHGEARELAFSPDGRFLVWVQPLPTWTTQLMCVDLKARRAAAVELTSGKYADSSPAFTRDGRYLVWLSARTFDPRYSEVGFDLSFSSTVRPYLAPLRAGDPAPFGPSADGWRISEVQSEADKSDGDDAPKPADRGKEKVPTVELDGHGFEERIVPFPVPSGRYAQLAAVKDGVTWRRVTADDGELRATRAGVEAEPEKDALERFSFETRSVAQLGHADSYAVSGDGQRLVVRCGDSLVVLPSGAKVPDDDPARVKVDLTRLRRRVDQREVWRQMFDENGRLMRDHYWRDDMDGVDWAGVLERYRPLLDLVTTRDDLVDVLWETVGELNTSHAYVTPPADQGRPKQGLLGADLARTAAGDWEIVRILPGESSDPSARSPLRAAGVGAHVGDVIVAVDGLSVGTEGPAALLQGAADKVVELTLRRSPGRGDRTAPDVRRVAVVPLADEEPLRYHAWVASRAGYVRNRSGGRLGYLHVPDMMARGWAQFHRDLALAMGHEGVVADMRYNRGGHTSQLIIEKLRARIIGYDLSRHAANETYPADGRRGPLVLVANQFSGSDGDMVNAAAQELGLGPVVGQRTWGGVVGIDGRFDLVDGTAVTQPRYAFHFDEHGWGIENHGVDPDIRYEMAPDDWRDEDARDPQLDLAVDEALRLLAESPASLPPTMPPPRVRRGE